MYKSGYEMDPNSSYQESNEYSQEYYQQMAGYQNPMDSSKVSSTPRKMNNNQIEQFSAHKEYPNNPYG